MLKSKFLRVVCRWQVISIFGLALCFFGCAGNPKPAAKTVATTKKPSAALSLENDPLFKNNDDPKQLWISLQESFVQLDPPKAWLTNHPSAETIAEWKVRKGQMALRMANQARNFYLRYPNVPEDKRAHESEYNLIEIVVNSGNTNLLPRLTRLDNEKLAAARTPEDRFAIRAHIVKRDADFHLKEGVPVVMSYLESGSRQLLKEFPDNPQAWQFLVTVADQEQDPQKSRKLAQEILSGNAAGPLKIQAHRILARLDRLGKPLPFRGTDLAGRTIDMDRLKGKVVLFHFWDTGCGYCLQELPGLKSLYDQYHRRGLEIISVSFDHDKKNLTRFLAKRPMDWPQYFAGTNWDAAHGRDFDIQAIPTDWLAGKRGNLRFLNARENLAADIEQLLDEPQPPVSTLAESDGKKSK